MRASSKASSMSGDHTPSPSSAVTLFDMVFDEFVVPVVTPKGEWLKEGMDRVAEVLREANQVADIKGEKEREREREREKREKGTWELFLWQSNQKQNNTRVKEENKGE